MSKLTADSLTAKQLDMIITVRQEYENALTEDFDDNDIIEKMKQFYKLYGLREPDVHISDSPEQFQYVLDKLKFSHNPEYPPNDNIDKRLFTIWKQIKESVDESTIDLVRRQLAYKINDTYSNYSALEGIIRRIILSGGLDLGRKYNISLLSIYDYFLRIGIIRDTSEDRDIEKFMEYMRAGIIYRLYKHDHAYIIRNNNGPQFKDELGRLNNEKGYAVVWRQDRKNHIESGLHFVKGVYFPSELFDKIFIREDISSEEIFGLRNTEQKAVAIHHIGYDKFIRELNAKKLDVWTTESIVNGNIANCELYEFELDFCKMRFVEVQDHSTGKKTVLGVPIIRDTETAKGAVAWTFGKKEHEYGPIIET